MYLNLLFIHSWLRWVILISLCIVLFRAAYGYLKKTSYTKVDNIFSIILVASTHTQVLLGFWLYFFLSPITTQSYSENFMKNPVLRYWKVEHLTIMLLFLILVQMARIICKKSHTPVRKHKVTFLISFLALVVLMLGMPWPNKPYGKPLFREAVLQSRNVP